MRNRLVCLASVCWLLASSVLADEDSVNRYWPAWRGPLGTGVAPNADPPIQWSESQNIRWKTELPGSGHSTPVVWKDHVFITAAIPFGNAVAPKRDTAPGAHDNLPVTSHHRFMVLGISRRDGKIVWKQAVREQLPHEGGHYSGSLASNSPVTDGEHLFAFFGSRGLYGFDLDGRLLWTKNVGRMQTKHAHGEGSSPVLYRDSLIVNWDHEGQSFVMAFDKRTGRERWKIERDEVTSWATPIVIEHAGTPQLIVSGTRRVRGYDPANGRVIWECGGLSANVVASPVAGGGMVFAASSYDTRALLAIRLEGARGDITGTDQVLWRRTRGTPYIPSPLLYGSSLYFLRHYQGVLSRVDTRTGEDLAGPFRLDGIRNVYASPVGAAGRVYITDRNGTTLVISHGSSPKFLAQNRLDDSFSASPALAERDLLLRGQRYLYCIAKKQAPTQ